MKKHTEARLEDAIVDSLVSQGGYVLVDYAHGPAAGRYDKARALDPALVLGVFKWRRGKPSRITTPLQLTQQAKSRCVMLTFQPTF